MQTPPAQPQPPKQAQPLTQTAKPQPPPPPASSESSDGWDDDDDDSVHDLPWSSRTGVGTSSSKPKLVGAGKRLLRRAHYSAACIHAGYRQPACVQATKSTPLKTASPPPTTAASANPGSVLAWAHVRDVALLPDAVWQRVAAPIRNNFITFAFSGGLGDFV